MKFEVDTETVLEKVTEQMLENLKNNAIAQGLSDEEEREIRKKLQQYQPKEAENIGKGGMANWVRKQVSNEIVESMAKILIPILSLSKLKIL